MSNARNLHNLLEAVKKALRDGISINTIRKQLKIRGMDEEEIKMLFEVAELELKIQK